MFQPVIKFLVPSFEDFLGPSLFSYEQSNFFQTNYFKPLIVKGFCLFRMPNDCCFRWAPQGQQCNRRNIVTVLRTVVKSHKGLEGTKVFGCGCFGRNLKNFSKFAGKSPCWSHFIVKLWPVIALKKNKITRSTLSKRDAYTETLTELLTVNFEKKLWTRLFCETASEIMSNKEFII